MGQIEQDALPPTCLYSPTGQAEQFLPSPVKPALHVQSAGLALAFGEFEFALHGVQEALPLPFL